MMLNVSDSETAFVFANVFFVSFPFQKGCSSYIHVHEVTLQRAASHFI